VAQARRKLALSAGTNWGGPSCYRAASRIALTCWTDGFAEAGAGDIEKGVGDHRHQCVPCGTTHSCAKGSRFGLLAEGGGYEDYLVDVILVMRRF